MFLGVSQVEGKYAVLRATRTQFLKVSLSSVHPFKTTGNDEYKFSSL
jgi:hypothetical protein